MTAKPRHLRFSKEEHALLAKACDKLLGTRHYEKKDIPDYSKIKDMKKKKNIRPFKPSQEQLGAIDYIYAEIEQKIEGHFKDGGMPQSYQEILKAIYTQREKLTAIMQRIHWMSEADKFPSENNQRPTLKEWEEILLQLHGVVTTDYLSSIDDAKPVIPKRRARGDNAMTVALQGDALGDDPKAALRAAQQLPSRKRFSALRVAAITDPELLFGDSSSVGDLGSILGKAGSELRRAMADIRDLLYDKFFTKRVTLPSEVVNAMQKHIEAIQTHLKKCVKHLEDNIVNENIYDDNGKPIATAIDVMVVESAAASTERFLNALDKALPAKGDDGQYRLTAENIKAMECWKDGEFIAKIKKEFFRPYKAFQQSDHLAGLQPEYNVVSKLIGQILPDIKRVQTLISPAGKVIFNQLSKQCLKYEYLPPALFNAKTGYQHEESLPL